MARSRSRPAASPVAVPAPPTPASLRHRGPSSDPAAVRSVLATLVVALTVALALSSHRLVHSVERQPLGPVRSVLLGVVEPAHDLAAIVGLDRPARALDRALGRGGKPGGGGPEPARADGDPEPAATVVEPDPPTGLAPGRGAAGSAPTTLGPPAPGSALAAGSSSTTRPEVGRPVSVDRPLRVWAGGDSLGEYIGNQLLHPVADRHLTAVELDYHISTGLTRPDYFDWPTRLRQTFGGSEPPEAAVLMLGGNDDQAMQGTDGVVVELGSPEWRDAYRRRVIEVMDSADTGVTQLYWIGLPPMRDERRDRAADVVNEILAAEAELRSWVTLVPTDSLFAGPDGGFSPHIADGEGRQRLARAPDGVHITYRASTWVAEEVWAHLVERWAIRSDPGEPDPPPLSPTGTPR